MFKGLYKYKATTYNTIRYCIYTLIKKVNCGHWLRSASLAFTGTTEPDRRSICSWQKDWRQVCFTGQRPLNSLVGLDHHYDSLLWKLWKLGKNEFLGTLLITFWEQGINFKLLRAKFNDPHPHPRRLSLWAVQNPVSTKHGLRTGYKHGLGRLKRRLRTLF